jgi:hypothetical protein
MSSRLHGLVVSTTIALMAVMLIGGSVAAALMRIDIPKWLEDADILIIAAAFGASGFFAQTAQMDRQSDTLGHVIERNHELAMMGTGAAVSMRTGTSTSTEGLDGTSP